MKIATKKTIAIASETPTWRLVSCSSSSTDWLAAIIRRADADRERLAEHDHATQARFAQDGVPVGHRLDVVGLDVDVARGATHGDRPMAGAAHHHPFDDGLAAVEVRGRGG